MRLNDRALGVLTIGLGLLLSATALRLPGVPGQELGAGFFPALLGAAAILTGLLLVLTGWRQTGEPVLRLPGWLHSGWARTNVAVLVLAIALFAAFAEQVGFIPLAIAIMLTVQLRMGIAPLRAGLIAVLGTIGFHLLFNEVLRVPLPPGVLEGWV
ncbi:tripartite tricarboxylate transporter TctB family protein [Roseomonas sp. E05]|uniref:tripartite tricarboxylate transporter TctB family protein n=1 Tax=Roseomonas sp. E05 TaxID=3046310 RepID=UPI0024BB4E01|nr:tripartite tricarboxylate transporter TctB family protein [Roseomonas sp. E05]MDJ0389333.1 tripartite tricarboxylate transporter TctB family protein [Roseomonas sp. E05]